MKLRNPRLRFNLFVAAAGFVCLSSPILKAEVKAEDLYTRAAEQIEQALSGKDWFSGAWTQMDPATGKKSVYVSISDDDTLGTLQTFKKATGGYVIIKRKKGQIAISYNYLPAPIVEPFDAK